MARSISRKARVDIPWVSWKDKLFWIVEFLRFRTAEPTWVRMGFIVKELARKPGWSQRESPSLERRQAGPSYYCPGKS